jgi:hypothetical protein
MAIDALMLELLYCTFVRYTAGEALNNGSRAGTNNSTIIGFARDETQVWRRVEIRIVLW